MKKPDPGLEQKFSNLERAIHSLKGAVATPPIEDRDFGGIIQAFESAYELTWKTLKAILEREGLSAPFPRVTFEEAFNRNMIEGNEIWKEIMEARNQSVHTYDRAMAEGLCEKIKSRYVDIFDRTLEKMRSFI